MKTTKSKKLFHHQTIRLLFLIIVLSIIQIKTSFAQPEIFFGNDEKIKSEKNLWGVKGKDGWTIPPKYDKIEGYGSLSKFKDGKEYYTTSGNGILICTKDNRKDIYDIGYKQPLIVADLTEFQLKTYLLYHGSESKVPVIKDKKWSGEIDEMTEKQIQIFHQAKSSNYPYIKNNLWGFAGKYYHVQANYDSIYKICLNNINKDCYEIIGVKKEGKNGLVTSNGHIMLLEEEYSNFKFWYKDDKDYTRKISFQHKSGIEVTINHSDLTHNEFRKIRYIETKGDNDLKGFVYYGNFIPPQYTDISFKNNPIGHWACQLPNGTVEYRNSTDASIISEEEMLNHQQLAQKQEEINQEKLKKLAEEKERKKIEENQKQEALMLLVSTKEDSLVGALMKVYFIHDSLLFNKVNGLTQYVKYTATQNGQGDYNRTAWPGQAGVLKESHIKDAQNQLSKYQSQIKSFEFVKEKIELYTAITAYLREVDKFLDISNSWADFIAEKVGENEEAQKLLRQLEKNHQSMKLGDNFLSGLIKEYQQSKKNTGAYLTTMKEAKNASQNMTTGNNQTTSPQSNGTLGEMNPFEVIKLVKTNALNDLLTYCKKHNQEFTSIQKDGNTEYSAKDPFDYGVKKIIQIPDEGLIIDFHFKDSTMKDKNMNQLKVEGFEARKVSSASAELIKDNIVIWFIPGTKKWQISQINR